MKQAGSNDHVEDRKAAYRYWGKARRDDRGNWSWHLLPYHCLDVAAVAEAWWRLDASLRSGIARACAGQDKHLRAWLLYFCALHDLGKWDVRFQLKVPEIAAELRSPVEANPENGYDHGRSGYAVFVREAGTSSDNALAWMRQVAGHHGALPFDGTWRAPDASPRMKSSDKGARGEWLSALNRLFLAPADADMKSLPPPPPHLAGLCCAADWLASNTDFFPYESAEVDFSKYFDSRVAAGERALRENGLLGSPTTAAGMPRVFPGLTPRGVQESVDQWPIRPGLTLIEAPTGSGKTEAALAYASRLLADKAAGGVIFALPTQATANAMLKRLEDAAARMFSGSANVVLAHGRARYNPDFMRLQRFRPETAQGREDASAQCSGWLASSRKKVFLGQVGVCTVDQVLLSVLPIRHGFMRGFGIHKNVLIIDEVHAYDSYMNGLLDEVLKRQKAAGGSAVLLSATLDSRRRRAILRLWDGAKETGSSADEPAPYPLISRADEQGREYWEAASPEATKRVALEAVPSRALRIDDAILERLSRAAEGGARVALICNLVADAQDAARRLMDSGAHVDVFHSRLRLCDRLELERRIIELYGANSRGGGRRVLVATQVVEQSLDLDFDWLATQLCPVDLLFQRLGRLHRRKRSRPDSCRKPRCSVVVPTSLEFGGHKHVYGNVRALWRTQRLIEQEGEVVFPDAYRRWIEAVYDDQAWPDEPPPIADFFKEFEAEEEARRLAARNMIYSCTTAFDDTDGNVTSLTRDGEMAASIVLLAKSDGERRFLDGEAILPGDAEFDERADLNSVPVPRGWAEGLPDDGAGRLFLELEASGEDEWRGVAGEAVWRYNKRFGLIREKK